MKNFLGLEIFLGLNALNYFFVLVKIKFKTNDDIEIGAQLTGFQSPIDLCKYKVSGIAPLKEDEEKV